ncbi:hypothetical protein FACS1894190_17920 [Spirochaetia bacterium]|nr:hypothetical protein FACS1894190_17920 [Spirochaetia bacterium]
MTKETLKFANESGLLLARLVLVLGMALRFFLRIKCQTSVYDNNGYAFNFF